MSLGRGIEHSVCSARESENSAVFILEEHRQFLIDYLRYRNFPYEVRTFNPPQTGAHSQSPRS